MDGEVIIIGDDGNEHVFPAGFDPKRAAAIVRSQGRQPDFKSETVAPAPTAKAQPSTDNLDRLLSLLPAVGGTVGGIVGGIGGTVAGMGVGGVPGAIGGAGLGGGFGESLRQLAQYARGRETPRTPLQAAGDIATQGGIQGASEVIGAGVSKAATVGAKAVYRGYLKPALSERMYPKAAEIVDTAIREALPISKSGAQTGSRLITELKAEVDGILAKSNDVLDLHGIADRVRAFAKKKYYKPGVDPGDYQAALKVADNLDQHAAIGLPAGAKPTRVDVPLTKANEAKQGLYESIKETGFGTANVGAKKTTEKVAANQIKKGLEQAAPAIAPLNARESKLIDAVKAIGKAVARDANQNPVYGVKTLAAVGVGGANYANDRDPVSATALALGTRMMLRPAVASRMAIIASRTAKGLGVSAATAARLAYYAVSSEQGAEDKP